MLSELEKERLIKRTEDARIRANNDLKIRKKLEQWLKEVPDISLILDYLPRDQLTNKIQDEDVYRVLNLIESILRVKRFSPISGDVKKPDEWTIDVSGNIKKPATDTDIVKSVFLKIHLDILKTFLGDHNPVETAVVLLKIIQFSDQIDRISQEEKKGTERVLQALRTGSLGDTGLFKLNHLEFLNRSFEGERQLNGKLIEILKSNKVERLQDILNGLNLDPNYIDDMQIVTNMLDVLCLHEIVKKSPEGWQWVG